VKTKDWKNTRTERCLEHMNFEHRNLKLENDKENIRSTYRKIILVISRLNIHSGLATLSKPWWVPKTTKVNDRAPRVTQNLDG